MLGNYLQQTTSADDIFRCIFFLGAFRVNLHYYDATKSTVLTVLQELISERDSGFAKLNQVIEAGEKLYPNTATDGREKVRQELRQMKMAWESLFDDLSSAQRKLEVALVQWTTFDDSYGQVEQWLRDAEMQLEGQIPLRSTLEEKKTQLQNFKVHMTYTVRVCEL